jgi:hypothetical protein
MANTRTPRDSLASLTSEPLAPRTNYDADEIRALRKAAEAAEDRRARLIARFIRLVKATISRSVPAVRRNPFSCAPEQSLQ